MKTNDTVTILTTKTYIWEMHGFVDSIYCLCSQNFPEAYSRSFLILLFLISLLYGESIATSFVCRCFSIDKVDLMPRNCFQCSPHCSCTLLSWLQSLSSSLRYFCFLGIFFILLNGDIHFGFVSFPEKTKSPICPMLVAHTQISPVAALLLPGEKQTFSFVWDGSFPP